MKTYWKSIRKLTRQIYWDESNFFMRAVVSCRSPGWDRAGTSGCIRDRCSLHVRVIVGTWHSAPAPSRVAFPDIVAPNSAHVKTPHALNHCFLTARRGGKEGRGDLWSMALFLTAGQRTRFVSFGCHCVSYVELKYALMNLLWRLRCAALVWRLSKCF